MNIAKWEYIKNVINVNDMSNVIDYLHSKKHWPYYDASTACHLYKNYLFLLAKYKKIIPPSYEINEAWRAHILTEPENYQEICKEIFGDHYEELSAYRPFYKNNDFILKRDSENFESITVDLFSKEFDQKLSEFNNNNMWSWFIEKISAIFQYHSVNKIIVTVAVPFSIVMYAGNVIHHNEVLSSIGEKLQKQTALISHQFENREKICNYTQDDKKNPNYLNQLYDFNNTLDQNLNDLIATYNYAYQRQLITEDLFKELGSFVNKYAYLLEKYQPYICSAPFESSEMAKQERINTNKEIQRSETIMKEKFFGFKLRTAHIIYTPEGPALGH